MSTCLMPWGVYSLYLHPAASPHTLPQQCRSLLVVHIPLLGSGTSKPEAHCPQAQEQHGSEPAVHAHH